MRTSLLVFLFFFLATMASVVYALSLPALSLRPVVYGTPQQSAPELADTKKEVPVDTRTVVVHRALPHAVKAIYMSQCYASMPNLRQKLITIANTTEVNSIIVDVKDYTGTISFTPDTSSVLVVGGKGCKVSDMRALVADMHAHGIYVIGRITVFQDPFMVEHHPEWAVKRKSDPSSVWKDRKGLGFIDVGAKGYWDYMIALARATHDVGFDELNFDYVRFPSDGNMKDALYTLSVDGPQKGTKAEHLERFFAYLTDALRAPYDSHYNNVVEGEHGERSPHVPVLSADVFGMVATNTDDLTIGQVLERALPHFDFVAPMVYPSHYPKGFNGYDNPNKHVYGVIKFSMDRAVARAQARETTVEGLAHAPATETVTEEKKNEKGEVVTESKTIPKLRDGKQVYTKPVYPATKLRTWIQDFDYGGDYGPKEVRDQFQATYDAGLTSWMIWSPSNRYTTEALKKE